MAILLGIVSAIGVVITLLWRLNQVGDATRGTMEAARDIKGMARGFAWRRKANRHPMEVLTDPREAAAAMMAAVAENDGAMTEPEKAAILDGIKSKFGASGTQADELLAHGRWLAKDVVDLGDFMRRATPLIRTQCDAAQKADLFAMLRSTASADGPADDRITSAINRMEHSLTG